MGTSAQSTSCSPLGNNNELRHHGETEKEQLCAPGDSPVPGAKITPLVLFINSGGTGSEWHTDVATAGSAGPTCLGLVPQWGHVQRGDTLGCLGLSIPFRAGKPTGGHFKIKSKIWAMDISMTEPQAAFSCQRPTCREFLPSPGLVHP